MTDTHNRIKKGYQNTMARLPNTATKAEREELHRAKMAGKVYDRERRFGQPDKITVMSRNEIRRRFGPSIARVNRHTGKPHEHAQEIMRRTMTPLERRAFRARVAAGLGIAA